MSVLALGVPVGGAPVPVRGGGVERIVFGNDLTLHHLKSVAVGGGQPVGRSDNANLDICWARL